MADTLIKMKTGTIEKLEREQNNAPVVPLDEGSVYFAVDTNNSIGKIVYDVSDGNDGVTRIVMGTQAEIADRASQLQTARIIDGVDFDGTSDVTHYNVCSTAANNAAKTVICNDFHKVNNRPVTGAKITVKYQYTNTAANPTLNVNSTGAMPIYYQNSAIPPEVLSANSVHNYVFDGTYWQYIGTIARNIGITVDDASYTMFITSPITNGDGVNY